MATIRPVYGTPATISCTLASLASDTNLVTGRQSAVVDNSAGTLIDALLGGKIRVGTSPTTNRVIEVWLFGSYDGTAFSAGLGGGDSAMSLSNKRGLVALFQVIETFSGSDVTYEFGPRSVAACFGGIMPAKWGVGVVHSTGVNLNASGHELKYTPVTLNVT